jgi:hypothetical protein
LRGYGIVILATAVAFCPTADAPKLIPIADFELAWLEMDQSYAILQPAA